MLINVALKTQKRRQPLQIKAIKLKVRPAMLEQAF
jgi:hypothetical protein